MDTFLARPGGTAAPARDVLPGFRYLLEPHLSGSAASQPDREWVLLAPDEGGRDASSQDAQAPPAWWLRYLEAADRCQLQGQFLADGLIRVLAEHPNLDLDAELAAQTPQAGTRDPLVLSGGLQEILP